jgi:CCR4-NOT transcription complex subunit 3
MSNARKLQTEIDRVMKKVDEGVALFDEIWEKVYTAEQQNQKEKYEMDLKKEIKKLQRLRDQIKTWIGSSDIKDKDNLLEARRLIETKMEQFKICEKETKTKTYSKEGLARAEKLDPAEIAKQQTTEWIGEYIERLNQLLEDREVEIERLSAGKGKKTNKHILEEYLQYVSMHKFHINKLEGIMRLVNNDVLDTDDVDNIRDDLDYYMESYEDDDYLQAYDEEYFYDSLGLDELDVVNVDRVTVLPTDEKKKKKSDDDSTKSGSKASSGKRKSKATAASSVIPLTIGRARVSSAGEKEKEVKTTPAKATRSATTGSVPAVPTPAARAPPPPAVATGGASMAAILKRESEQQEKERQQKAQLLREQQARQQAEQQRLQQLQLQQQKEAQLRQQEALRQQQAEQEAALKQQQLQQQQQLQEQQARKQAVAQQEAAAQQQKQLQAQQQAAQQQQQQAAQKAAAQQRSLQSQVSIGSQGSGALDIIGSGLGGLSLNSDSRGGGGGVADAATHSPLPSATVSPQPQQPAPGASFEAANLVQLNESFATMPTMTDSERQRQYTPRNPYPVPASYPQAPSQVFDHPAVFEKLGTDCLFFIFYYQQGTYQQYLAARELKKQSWRYHKKYMTWFQRHEEPKVTTDEYEQGTYVYFDYETGWCQRIKADFRFEYSFLEDSLQ